MKLPTIDDYNFKGKATILRVDINSPINGHGRLVVTERFYASAETIKELSKKGAKLVVLSHQGRKGKKDFISLRKHAKVLEKLVGKKVKFVNDIVGKKAKNAIKNLRDGEILLLDNVRFLEDETLNKPPEEHAKSTIVKELAPLADVFVNDAFSAAHRSHASIVGFTAVLPSFAGRTMEKEVRALSKLMWRLKISKRDVFILGGAKPEDPIKIMKHMLEENGYIDRILTCGVLGELFLVAQGYDLGRTTISYLKKAGYLEYLDDVKKLWKKHSDRIEAPIDVAVDKNGKRVELTIDQLPTKYLIQDIGIKTAVKYVGEINGSKNAILKGPAGVFEKEGFEIGTRIIFEGVANSPCFSLAGGGHTLSVLQKFNVDKSKFSHVSIGGGALITYLSGKPMPGIEALLKH
ncbi:MAG: phosphoglycerate kinase [Candidatus Aenigmarchaeota archaeon]|nr:phosphoglycerate kinase [Candidatus Aenigmarchaeota archaeon]